MIKKFSSTIIDYKWTINFNVRNALVRSNYFNNYLNIKQDNSFLIKFYENLLLGKNNNLHSRNLIIEEGQDHHFSKSEEDFQKIPEKYLFEMNPEK